MLFSEKLTQIPQPARAALWQEYRTLCTALSLQITLNKERRSPNEAELVPLKQAAAQANAILKEYGFPPSFFPESEDFFSQLTVEMTSIANTPSKGID